MALVRFRYFNLEYSGNQQVKLPAILGHLLLEDDLCRKIQPIHLYNRNYVMVDKSGDLVKSYAPRYYILNTNRELNNEIAKKTKNNLLFFVKDRKFFSKCKEGHTRFKQLKIRNL